MFDLLILGAQTGGGHMSLAAALQDLLAPYATATIAAPLPRSMAAYYRTAVGQSADCVFQ